MPNAAARSACTSAVAMPSRGTRRRSRAGVGRAHADGRSPVGRPGRGPSPRPRTGRARWSRRASSRRWPAAGTGTGWPGWWARPRAWSRFSRAARRPAPSQAGRARGHLQVRVGTGREPAEHLEHPLLAEDEAGVALLVAEHQAVEAGVERRPGDARIRTEPISAPAAIPASSGFVEIGVGQRVVGDCRSSPRRPDPGVPQPGREPPRKPTSTWQ